MCDGRSLASPLLRRLAGRGAFFCGFPFRWVLHFVSYLIRGVALHESSSCSRENSLMIVGAHAILYLAFSFRLCGFDATNPYWYRRPSQQRISSSHVLRHSCSEMQHACK